MSLPNHICHGQFHLRCMGILHRFFATLHLTTITFKPPWLDELQHSLFLSRAEDQLTTLLADYGDHERDIETQQAHL